jgi:hypothetical protein
MIENTIRCDKLQASNVFLLQMYIYVATCARMALDSLIIQLTVMIKFFALICGQYTGKQDLLAMQS